MGGNCSPHVVPLKLCAWLMARIWLGWSNEITRSKQTTFDLSTSHHAPPTRRTLQRATASSSMPASPSEHVNFRLLHLLTSLHVCEDACSPAMPKENACPPQVVLFVLLFYPQLRLSVCLSANLLLARLMSNFCGKLKSLLFFVYYVTLFAFFCFLYFFLFLFFVYYIALFAFFNMKSLE